MRKSSPTEHYEKRRTYIFKIYRKINFKPNIKYLVVRCPGITVVWYRKLNSAGNHVNQRLHEKY